MLIQLELWHLISLLLAFFACVGAFGQVIVRQFEKRLEERFAAMDAARKEGQKIMRESFDQHLADERRNTDSLLSLEREFLSWKADLPIHYVRREDYVRGQVVIEAKIDAVYNKLEVVQLKGALQ